MSQTARDLDIPFEVTAAPRARLEVVPGAPDGQPEAEVEHEPNAGRWAMVGYVVGFILTCLAVTVAGTFGGMGFAASLGLGAFIGLWGGGGFGFMLGGTIPLALEMDAQHSRPETA